MHQAAVPLLVLGQKDPSETAPQWPVVMLIARAYCFCCVGGSNHSADAHFKSRRKLLGGVVGWSSGTVCDRVDDVFRSMIVSPELGISSPYNCKRKLGILTKL